MSGISKSQVSRLCEDIDQRVKAFLDRPIEGDWPYLWIDATYVKVRQAGRIVSVAVIVAVGVNADGRREVLGMDIGPSEAETFWTAFLRKLARRGLRGCEARRLRRPRGHQGRGLQGPLDLLAALPRPLHAQCPGACRQEWPAGRLAFIATAFAQDDAELAKAQWRRVADQLRPKVPKLAALMDEAEPDVLAYMSFPPQHRTKLHSTNPLERLNGEIKRRTEVVGNIPQRGRHYSPRRRHPARTERRVGRPARRATSRWKASLPSAMIPSSACQSRQTDRSGPNRTSSLPTTCYTTPRGTIDRVLLSASGYRSPIVTSQREVPLSHCRSSALVHARIGGSLPPSQTSMRSMCRLRYGKV